MEPTDNPFEQSNRVDSVRPVPPPVPLLVVGTAALGASLILMRFGQYTDWAHALGWALASIVCIGMITVFTAQDLKRRQSAWYSPRPGAIRYRTALGIAAIVISAINAWILAWSIASR